jgi:hypothetical protein
MTLTLDVSESPTTFISMAGLGDNGVRYGPGRNQPGKCTRWNWLAAGAGVGFANTTSLNSAVDGWNTTPNRYRHPMTVKPFRGAVICFGATAGPRWAGDENWRFGDYATFTGANLGDDPLDWQLVATDAAGIGVIGVVTVRERIRQTGGRGVLGWSDYLGGAVLTHGTASPTPAASTQAPSTTSPVQEDHMLAIRNSKNGAMFGIAPGRIRHCTTQREFDLIVKATPGNVRQQTDASSLALILRSHGIPEAAADPAWITRNADKDSDGHTWSAVGQLTKALVK